MDLILMRIGAKKMEQKINSIMNLMDSIEYGFKDENGENIINANPQKWEDEFYKFYYLQTPDELLKSKCISIVGCREPSKYGINCAKYFGFNLANNGICIVSGLARGIDSYAHIGAITAKNGKTIAVLGNGLDTIYPKENIELAKKILDLGGAIISEYPLGMPPNRANFPARNRIVSGLSTGVLVIEAKEKSGTLITVDFALEQGRDVYVVPGNINSINSVGTNKLIKEGAILVNNYKDLL